MMIEKKTGFVYSAYYRIWSRLLGVTQDGQTIEINLTASNGDYKNMRKELIRKHYTPLGKVYGGLPDEVHVELERQLGKKHTDRLLTFDYLTNIDWSKHRKNNNGGCEFFLCQGQEQFPTWQQVCHTRESAIRYLANKPNSYAMFHQLPWKQNSVCLTATTVAFIIIHDTDRGFWEVHRKDAESVRFHSLEQTIAYIVHKWW